MADKTKLKSDIRKLKSAIASKSTPKTIIPKLKSQLEKAENELANLSKGKKTKSTHASTTATLSKLQTLVKKNKKYSIYKGSSTSNLQKDAERPALPMGKRTSQGLRANGSGSKKSNKGHTYYEYRRNRIDVKQPRSKQRYPILEDGGMMACLRCRKTFGRTRGLCHRCYAHALADVHAGRTSWAAEEAKGLSKPPDTAARSKWIRGTT